MKTIILIITLAALGLAQEPAAPPVAAKKVQLSAEDSLKMSLYSERFQAAQQAVTEAYQTRQEHINALCAKAKIEPATDCQIVPSGKDTWVAQAKPSQVPPVSAAPEGKKKVEAAKAQ